MGCNRAQNMELGLAPTLEHMHLELGYAAKTLWRTVADFIVQQMMYIMYIRGNKGAKQGFWKMLSHQCFKQKLKSARIPRL